MWILGVLKAAEETRLRTRLTVPDQTLNMHRVSCRCVSLFCVRPLAYGTVVYVAPSYVCVVRSKAYVVVCRVRVGGGVAGYTRQRSVRGHRVWSVSTQVDFKKKWFR